MLGRLKHEGANVAVTPDGHVVAYMGDDQAYEYLYKFVSRDTFQPRRAAGRRASTTWSSSSTGRCTSRGSSGEQPQPLTGGVREHDGGGDWIPLTSDTQSYVAGHVGRQTC